MSLKDDKQQNIQMELDFSSALTGEARGVAGEETESLMATNGPESPARTDRLMEEVCERENLKEALRRVKGNKGSAGVDGITVSQLTDYPKQHRPVIREQLLNGTYEPKAVRSPNRTAGCESLASRRWLHNAPAPILFRMQKKFCLSCAPNRAMFVHLRH